MEKKPGSPVRLFSTYARSSTRRVRLMDGIAGKGTMAAGLLIVALLVLLLNEMFRLSLPAICHFGIGFFTSSDWDPQGERFGVLPFLYGTLVSSAIALVIAIPFGIGTALFLTELAPQRLRGAVAFVVDMLAAIPSVVYGLWGVFVLAPLMQSHVGPFLEKTLGFLPLFRGPFYGGVSMLTAGLILAVMVVPFIVAIAREVLLTVPVDLKAASYALGATQWETIWKVVLPYSRVGIGGGVVLALGRALGETMAVTMVIGNQPRINASILQPGYSMAAVLANEFNEASSKLYLSVLVEVGLTLFLVTFLINIAARVLLWRMRSVHPH
ncbi:MAG: phosphate ABC transporter permease subunit PstC [Candidatus Sumerlaeaceae bacterium]|nr:phosphate ABC transporter permease subunit PstC [Candidatus Sumerlaeaceae bacterium]